MLQMKNQYYSLKNSTQGNNYVVVFTQANISANSVKHLELTGLGFS